MLYRVHLSWFFFRQSQWMSGYRCWLLRCTRYNIMWSSLYHDFSFDTVTVVRKIMIQTLSHNVVSSTPQKSTTVTTHSLWLSKEKSWYKLDQVCIMIFLSIVTVNEWLPLLTSEVYSIQHYVIKFVSWFFFRTVERKIMIQTLSHNVVSSTPQKSTTVTTHSLWLSKEKSRYIRYYVPC
jgi:hypothetical protein